MALNYNTFQALSATEVFVLQESALSFIQLSPPSSFGFSPYVPSFTFTQQEVVNFFAVPGCIANGQFSGPVYVQSNGLQLVTGPLPPFFSGGPLPAPLPSVKFFEQPNVAPAAFQTPSNDLSVVQAFVLGLDGDLWFLNGIDNPSVMTSTQIDGHAAAFQALSDSKALVLGSNGNLLARKWSLGAGAAASLPDRRERCDSRSRGPRDPGGFFFSGFVGPTSIRARQQRQSVARNISLCA